MSKDNTLQGSFSVIADFEGNINDLLNVQVDGTLPVLPLRNMVLFPGVVASVAVGRESSRTDSICRATRRGRLYCGILSSGRSYRSSHDGRHLPYGYFGKSTTRGRNPQPSSHSYPPIFRTHKPFSRTYTHQSVPPHPR